MSRDPKGQEPAAPEGAPRSPGRQHQPVMCAEIVQLFEPAAGGVIVDCTVGDGGHGEALLTSLEPPIRLIGIDRDEQALARAAERLDPFGRRVVLRHRSFDGLSAVLAQEGQAKVAGILYDLGIASGQIDTPERGFSYQSTGPLDMRMDATSKLTAREVVNEYDLDHLERVIRAYGEERFSRRIARAIVAGRPIENTSELAAIVIDAIPAAARRHGRNPARRTFQALRIEVNDELAQLEASLPQALDALTAPGGRICAISYHSLEDRRVKSFFRKYSKGCICPPRLPECGCGARPLLREVRRGAMKASEVEVASNPRASSARLRCAERTGEAEAASG